MVIVGVLNRFEIWAPEAWKSFLPESERLLDDVSFDLQWPPPPARTLRHAPPRDPRHNQASTGETQDGSALFALTGPRPPLLDSGVEICGKKWSHP